MNVLAVLQGALAQGMIWGIMALGAYISYKVLDFADLSVDGTFALGGAVSMVLTVNGMNPFLSLPFAMLAGMGGGLVTALLATKIKIPGLLAGILTMLSLYSINLMIMGSPNTPIKANLSVVELVQTVLPVSHDLASSLIGAVFCVVLIALLYCFFGTELGCALRASGNNPHMAKALGVNTDTMVIVGLMLSNGLVALSGGLWTQHLGVADVNVGVGVMVTGLASIIIGQVIFRFLRRNFALKLAVAVLGSICYWLVVTLVVTLGLGTNNLKLLTALMVVIAMAVPMVKEKIQVAAHVRGEGK
ncbi:MAG: ABC transporter permease [Oscillospiraceae bacterium]